MISDASLSDQYGVDVRVVTATVQDGEVSAATVKVCVPMLGRPAVPEEARSSLWSERR